MPTTCTSSMSAVRRVLLLLLLLPAVVVLAMSRSEALRELRLKGKDHFTAKELKAAYRKRSLETHPDKEGGSKEAFLRVAEAYEELSASSGERRKFARRRPKEGATAGSSEQVDEEILMKMAEDMFFDMFDDLFQEDTVGDAIDHLFAQFGGEHAKLGYGMKLVKSFIKWAAPKVMRLVESESTTININGKTMSGTEFKEWRERKKQERKKKIPEKDL